MNLEKKVTKLDKLEHWYLIRIDKATWRREPRHGSVSIRSLCLSQTVTAIQ